MYPFRLLVYDHYFDSDDFRLFFPEYAIKVACHYTWVLSYLPSHAVQHVQLAIFQSQLAQLCSSDRAGTEGCSLD